jgi:hypothetical protein
VDELLDELFSVLASGDSDANTLIEIKAVDPKIAGLKARTFHHRCAIFLTSDHTTQVSIFE